MAKTTQSIAFDPELLKGIKQLAEADNRSFSAYVHMVLADHLREKQAAEPKPKGKAK